MHAQSPELEEATLKRYPETNEVLICTSYNVASYRMDRIIGNSSIVQRSRQLKG